MEILVDLSKHVPGTVADGRRLVGAPPEISTHPVQPPLIGGADIPDSRKRTLPDDRSVTPVWPDLEEIDRVADDRVSEVQFVRDVGGSWRCAGNHFRAAWLAARSESLKAVRTIVEGAFRRADL